MKRKSATPITWPEGNDDVWSISSIMSPIGGRSRAITGASTCTMTRPRSMPPARRRGRHACFATKPQVTMVTRMMIGITIGPNTNAMTVMTVVSQSDWPVSSHRSTGASTVEMSSASSTESKMKRNAARPAAMSSDRDDVEVAPGGCRDDALLDEELLVEAPQSPGMLPRRRSPMRPSAGIRAGAGPSTVGPGSRCPKRRPGHCTAAPNLLSARQPAS